MDRRETAPTILAAKTYGAPSVFRPENLLREGRRQRGVPDVAVPAVCALDPDGDIVRSLRTGGRSRRAPGWACYHTDMDVTEHEGLTVGIVGGDVGHHGRRQMRRLRDLLSLLLDRAFLGEVAQNPLQLGAVGVLQAELARNFPGADLAGICSDKGDDGVPRRKGRGKTIVAFAFHFVIIRGPCLRSSLPTPSMLPRALPPKSSRSTLLARAPC